PLAAAGRRAIRFRLHLGRAAHEVPLFELADEDTPYGYVLFLSQADTERRLTEHLAARDVRIERGTELVGLQPQGDALRATVRGPQGERSLHARYVVGCDGAHSAVRHLAGIGFTGGAYPQTYVLGDLEADGLERETVHAFVRGRGLLLFFPLVRPASWRM